MKAEFVPEKQLPQIQDIWRRLVPFAQLFLFLSGLGLWFQLERQVWIEIGLLVHPEPGYQYFIRFRLTSLMVGGIGSSPPSWWWVAIQILLAAVFFTISIRSILAFRNKSTSLV